jgi:hypothetical protein
MRDDRGPLPTAHMAREHIILTPKEPPCANAGSREECSLCCGNQYVDLCGRQFCRVRCDHDSETAYEA